MTVNRTITLALDPDAKEQIADVAGYAKLNEAIGYLSAWNMSYPHATVECYIFAGSPELIATYRKEPEGDVGYQIVAVWHDTPEGGHFGFHS